MANYIDKSALVAEIERRRESNAKDRYFGRLVEDNYFLDFIATLEAKEVDLDEETDNYWETLTSDVKDSIYFNGFYKIAKHFFELGVNASNPLTWEDISAIRQITAEYRREENHKQNNKDFCKEVLKRFKTQKGE